MVVVIDAKKNEDTGYTQYTNNGTLHMIFDNAFAKKVQDLGAGNSCGSIDRDGLMTGYDHELVENVYSAVEIPIFVIGGAGSVQHIKDLFQNFNIIGACAGSLFVFKGNSRQC